MNNVMTNSFCELDENEMMVVDGGWDGKMWASGFRQALTGIGSTIGGAANVVCNPNPIAKIGGGISCIGGVGTYYAGAKAMYNSFFY